MRSFAGASALAVAIGALVAAAGCAPADSDEVASLAASGGSDHGGYVNAATAAYAECLAELDITVAPLVSNGMNAEGEGVPPGFAGYAEIEGAYFLGDSFDGTGTEGLTIGIDGVDRNEEIRGCYDKNAGAKDAALDSYDDPGFTEQWSPPQEVIDVTLEWVACAREAGVTVIEDPGPAGYVVIPQALELSEAKMLGQKCSAPMAQESATAQVEAYPYFQWEAGIEDAQSDLMDVGPYQDAINGPFYKAICERNPDECSGAE